MRVVVVSAFVLGAAAAVATAVQNPMRPGQWEIVMNMQMPNMPMAMPEMKVTECITPEQLEKDPTSGLPRVMASKDGKQACTVSDYKIDGSTVTWKMACTGQMPMDGTGEMTFKGDSYTGLMKMTAPQGEITMKFAGKRMGDCTKP
jgi:hypothetical protein